jgi:hypothetical protein
MLGCDMDSRMFASRIAVAYRYKLNLKPGFHLIGSMIETRRFRAMGQTEFNLDSPHRERKALALLLHLHLLQRVHRAVTAQVLTHLKAKA